MNMGDKDPQHSTSRPKRTRKLNSFFFGDDMISAHSEKRHKSNESKADSGDNDTSVQTTSNLPMNVADDSTDNVGEDEIGENCTLYLNICLNSLEML